MTVRRRIALSFCMLLAASGCASLKARAQEGRGGLLAPGAPTLGGGFVWSDEVVYDDWRIEKNAVIGHYRLVDPQNRRQAFGSYETCLAALDKAKVDYKLAPMPKHVVITLHGLGARRQFMDGLADYLRTEGGYTVVNIGYASTMDEIQAFAVSLDNVIRHLDGVESVDFVAHSMGNIVVRRYLADQQRLAPEMRSKVKYGRMVMISPPNHGAEFADIVQDRELLKTVADMVAGKPVAQLGPKQGWPEFEKTLVTPDFDFGIIVGGQGDDSGYLPQVPGDDDGLLSIETQKLAGATDFVQIHGLHQFMPRYKEVREMTLSYLKNGYFLSADSRRPIADDVTPEVVATP